MGDPGSTAWYEYYAYYAEPTMEQKIVDRYFTVDNGQLTPKPVSADTGGAGNFSHPDTQSKPKNWWDQAVQGTQNFLNGAGKAIGKATNWVNQNVVKPVDKFLNTTLGHLVEGAILGLTTLAGALLTVPEDTAAAVAVGGELGLGDMIASAGRAFFGGGVGDSLDWTIGTIKTDPGVIIPKAVAGGAVGEKAAGTASEGAAVESTIGDSFGKMGTYVEKPDLTVDWNQSIIHGADSMAKRGITQEMVDEYVSNGKALFQGNGKYAFVSPEGVAVVGSDGTLVTAWTSANYDESMQEIVNKLFGK